MWVLQLNPMMSNAEHVVPVAWGETKEQLEALLEREKTEPYREDNWLKSFKKGGILELFNPPDAKGESWIDVPSIVDVGTEADWMKQASDRFNDLKSRLVAA